DLAYLSAVHNEFASTGTSAVDTSAGVLRGRPHGGVALLWRKSVFSAVSIVKCSSVRLCAIKCKIREHAVLFFSVYMPTDCPDNLMDFTECLSEMNAIVEDCAIGIVFMLGDFNAHPGEPFFNEMLQFCGEQSWVCADYEQLPKNTDVYTYVSDSHGCSRWLDHCLVTELANKYIQSINVVRDVSWSDHYPMEVYCNINLDVPQAKSNPSSVTNQIIWGLRNSEQTSLYTKICNDRLSLIDFPMEMAVCCDRMCNNPDHRLSIDKLYEEIIGTLQYAAISCYKDVKRYRKRYITGWNKHVKPAHVRARLCFQCWDWVGRPTCGALYEEMAESRKLFKSKLKWCQDNEEQI
ncbi:jg4679, partial [Pararge aegeria aegeria]